MKFVLAFLSIVCAGVVVNAAPATLTPKQLSDYMLANGDDGMQPAARHESASLLGLRTDVEGVPIKGDSTDDNEIGPDTQSTCKVVLEKNGNKAKPVCMLIVWEKVHRRSHKLETYYFRFTTDGKLERAISSDARVDDSGEGVPGSANTRALDIKSPTVSKRAKQELAFWLKRTAKVMAKKKATASK
jgi:hypothetical protein